MDTAIACRPRHSRFGLRAAIVWLALAAPAMVAASPNGGLGEFPSSAPGRYVAMVSPTNGESFYSPLNLRLVAAGFDENVFTNEPVDGKGTNAAKVEFFLDATKIYEQNGTDAEYCIFKGYVSNLAVTPGTHVIWARATYTNVTPTLFLDSPPFTITVRNPPAYAQTVDLISNVVLTGAQSYELTGTASGRVRLNGHGFRIISSGSGTSGKLTLKFVDVVGLGGTADTSVPGIDVTGIGSGAIAIEDSVFDSSNPVNLRLNGSATASLRRNLFRSNMRMPIGQFPDGATTIPVMTITGTSGAAKVFAGNNVGAGPVHFESVNHWTIGWATGAEANADSNVLIGPRAAFELIRSANMTVRGNFVHHTYYGGWSQGQLLEVHETSPILVEHNVLMDSSWPVRGIAGEFRYNLVLKGGHQWMVPDDGAYVHHNIFIGGDLDTGGITGYYDINARVENNTFDGLRGHLVNAAVSWRMGTTTLKSNAFINVPTGAIGVVEKQGGTVNADYNGFNNPETTNYTDHGTPAHDVNGGAKTDPQFVGPLPATTFDMNEVSVWTGDLTVGGILTAYRARYTPRNTAYIDTGDPAGGAGNDVGAIGAGTANVWDKFGIFGDLGPGPGPGTDPGDGPGGGGGGGTATDSDGDGLSDECETRFGLDPASAAGDNGAAGDPDHDGRTNLQECTDGTHPRGFFTRYLAEGSSSAFFETTIDLANPDPANDARVLLRFLKTDGTIVTKFVLVPKQRHATVSPTSVAGMEAGDFSTVIESDHEVVAERTMVWTPTERYGSHGETAVKAPSTDWFLAEGATHGVFSLFYLLENAADTDANVQIRYLLPAPQAPIVLSYIVAAHSRRTIAVDDEPGLEATDVSAAIHCTNGVPIIVERAMYFSSGGIAFRGGHDSAGVTQPAAHWFFAEGATGTFFNMFLLLANPDATRTAHVDVSYLLTDGTVVPVHHDVAPNSRQTYNVADEAPALASAAFSSVVDSDVPIVAERSMYWPHDWTEAHNSPGSTETGTMWAVAGGEEGGAFGAQTYVLIANTSTFAGTARLTVLLENAAPLTLDIPLAPNSRTSVPIGATTAFAAAIGTRFGVVVQSLGTTPARIVVERATYSNDASGTVWAAGNNVLATKLQ
jgi:hypothetical protein